MCRVSERLRRVAMGFMMFYSTSEYTGFIECHSSYRGWKKEKCFSCIHNVSSVNL